MNHILVTSFIFYLLAAAPIESPQQTSLLNLGPEEIVQANGIDIQVPGYSVPSFIEWNNDGLKDLVIGQGSGAQPPGKVRVYLNVGTETYPQFSDFVYVKSKNADLTIPASGCMGCYPRVVYWDTDDRKDLLVGLADGTIKIFLNVGTDNEPVFDGGSTVQTVLYDSNSIVTISTGGRATPELLDWNDDNKNDLVVGALDGKIHIYLNYSADGAALPQFWAARSSGALAQEDGKDLVVPFQRSSPAVFDLDGDGRNDLISGNTEGQLFFYHNIGTAAEPNFSDPSRIDSNGVAIDLPSQARSRPSVCFWTSDGYPDVIIGAADGKVHLFQVIPAAGDINLDGSVDFVDFALLAVHWRYSAVCSCSRADLTGDGKVNIDDLRLLAENWLRMP